MLVYRSVDYQFVEAPGESSSVSREAVFKTTFKNFQPADANPSTDFASKRFEADSWTGGGPKCSYGIAVSLGASFVVSLQLSNHCH